MVVEQQGRQRRSYISTGAYVMGSNALDMNAYPSTPVYPQRRREAPRNYYKKPVRPQFQAAGSARRPAAARQPVFSVWMMIAVAMTAVLVTMGFMWLVQLSEYTAVQYDVAQMGASIAAQQEANRLLSQELESMKNGERIRTYAVNRLGMVAPGKGEERTISINLPRTQDAIIQTEEEKHYTLLDVLIDLI